MKRLNVTLKTHCYTDDMTSGHLAAAQRVVTQEATGEDFTLSVEAFNTLHPYLLYCKEKGFSEEALLERQTEIVGALGAVLGRAFGAIKGSVVKVMSSGKFIPFKGLLPLIGMTPTYGGITTWFAWDFAITKGMSLATSGLSFNADGISDGATLSSLREQMPSSASFKLKDAVWPGKRKMATVEVLNALSRVEKLLIQVDVLGKNVKKVVTGGTTVDKWLTALDSTGNNKTWTIKPVHRGIGFMVYANGKKYYLEKVTVEQPFATSAAVPTLMELKDIQSACKRIDSSLKKLIKAYPSYVKPVKTDAAPSADEPFIYKTAGTLHDETVSLATLVLKDTKNFVQDAVAAIVGFRPKEGSEEGEA